ncbi:MAG TPA: TerB family tellurite resistance protein [Gemmatimonadales bacterium]|nr:TerB family tellurite resistance protein [Gemmatimonadales bacterium]
MLEAIRRFVRGLGTDDPKAASGGTPASGSVQLAACALLLELAHADDEFSAEERRHIEGTLQRHFGLDQVSGAELIKLAEAARAKALDHFQFTRVVATEYSLAQKMVLAEVMWGVILADGRLSDHETHLVRKMASLMQLEPAYLAEARRAAVGGRP